MACCVTCKLRRTLPCCSSRSTDHDDAGQPEVFLSSECDNKLQPYFITVSNIESKDPTQIIEGNEKVVRPRLSDAEFFFLQDQKQPLASRKEKLANMVFQAQLGTLWNKSERIAKLAVALAPITGAKAADAEKAALLAKCDLTSELGG